MFAHRSAVLSLYRRIIRASRLLASASNDPTSAPLELGRLSTRIRFNLRIISAARRDETDSATIRSFLADGHNAAALIEHVAAMSREQVVTLFRRYKATAVDNAIAI